MKFIVNCGTFPFDIMVCLGTPQNEALDDFAAKLPESDNDEIKRLRNSEWKQGKFMMAPTMQSLLWTRNYPFTSVDYGVLQHEISHAAFEVLRRCGLKFCRNSEEAYTYLIEYLTDQIYSKILIKNKEDSAEAKIIPIRA